MKKKVIDCIINRLLQVRDRTEKNFPLSECEIRQLCEASRKIFLEQPILLEVEPPINICGDTHGQYSDLLRIFDLGGYPPHTDYLFLGDYVDRGDQGLETICLLLAYKIKCPRKIFLLRGNHETVDMNKKYGFYEQCEEKFNEGLWKTFIECFNCLPLAAIVGEKIFCVHGGISRHLHDLDQIRKITRPTESEIPYEGLLCDLLWSDPSNKIHGWGKNTTRNCSCFFGPDKVTEFLLKHDLDLICRGHQDVDGYEFFAGQQLVTIFSAPNYNGRNNSGAMMSVDENLKCSFQLIEPSYEKPTTGVKGKSSLDKEIDCLKLEIGEVTTKLKELTAKLEQLERKSGRRISPARYYD